LFVVVELILSVLVGGNKLLLGACTSLLLLMAFPKLFSLSNGFGDKGSIMEAKSTLL
jgi:hypothetical protein